MGRRRELVAFAAMPREPEATAAPLGGSLTHALGLDFEDGGDIWRGDARIPATGWLPGFPFPRASVLLSFADTIAGSQVRALTLPRLSVTVELTLDVVMANPGQRPIEHLEIESTLRRRGKRIFITETTFALPDGTMVAVCGGTFSGISRTDSARPDSGQPRSNDNGRLLSGSVADRIGIRSLSPGVAEIALRNDLGNSTNSLMGGLTAILGEMAALSRLRADAETDHLVERLQIRYLTPIDFGPARAEVRLVGGPPGHPVVLVEVRDTALPDAVAADLTLWCRPVPHTPEG